MVAFYVRQITVKKTMTLDKVPAYWHDDVKAELIRIGYMQADPVIEEPPVTESTPETPAEGTTETPATTPESTPEDTTTTP